MAAIAATTILNTASVPSRAMLILEAVATYKGARAKLNGFTHGTSAHQGRVEGWDATADVGSIPFGVFDRGGTGTSGALTGDESEEIRQVCDLQAYIRESIAVTGASARTDVGKILYFSNNNDLTLTRPTTGIPAGFILDFVSASSFHVYMFSVETMFAIALGGAGQCLMNLGSMDCDVQTTGDVRTGIAMPFHGRFLDFFAMVDVACAGGGGTTDVNLEIGGTDVTGGVITVSTAAGGTRGTKLSGTAITAANVFHEGDLVDIERTAGTDMTAGRVDLWATVEMLPGV